MRRISKWPTALIIILLVTVSLTGCGGKKDVLCCNEVGSDFASIDRSYCMSHRDAAGLFILTPATSSEQKVRLDAFGQFYEIVEDCQSLDCIQAAVDTCSFVPLFKPEYDHEHARAEEKYSVNETEKSKLILCGFRHAISAGIKE